MELDTLIDIIEKPTWKTLLVTTVKTEGMDPWSIDVALLASEYGERIRNMRLNDFRVPANAVLASAILVRFKSDSWNLVPVEAAMEESVQEFELGLLDFPEVQPTQRLTTRRVTLEELIHAIDQVMDKTKKKAGSFRMPVEVMELTIGEKEEFRKGVDEVYERVLANLDSEKIALFSDLLEEKTRPEIVRVLLSVLQLCSENRVSVWQEKQFGEIFVSLKEASA
jgi:chromatin segregation and condensation protein Rec8/ScpA/Scc1 (kleisin family)